MNAKLETHHLHNLDSAEHEELIVLPRHRPLDRKKEFVVRRATRLSQKQPPSSKSFIGLRSPNQGQRS